MTTLIPDLQGASEDCTNQNWMPIDQHESWHAYCGTCKGTGRIPNRIAQAVLAVITEECGLCGGSGLVDDGNCPWCSGTVEHPGTGRAPIAFPRPGAFSGAVGHLAYQKCCELDIRHPDFLAWVDINDAAMHHDDGHTEQAIRFHRKAVRTRGE